MICVLEIVDGPANGRGFWLRSRRYAELGRGSNADFSIPTDLHLSRHHLIIDWLDDGFRVKDLGSANGTFLNNQRISLHAIQTGDVLRAGKSTFRIQLKKTHDQGGMDDSLPFGCFVIASEEFREPEQVNSRTVYLASKAPSGNESFEETRILRSNDGNETCTPNMISMQGIANYFEPTSTPNVYRLIDTYMSDQGIMCGVLEIVARNLPVTLIINESQARVSLSDAMRSLTRYSLEQLSKSMFAVQLRDSTDGAGFAQQFYRKDALVCLAGPNKVDIDELRPFINAISFPSLFSRHIRDESSFIRSYLLTRGIQAIYEPSESSHLELFRP